MATHTFYSTDAGAPTVTGQSGGILAMLRAVLVNGYNTHSTGVSITRSGSTATVTRNSHGYRSGQIIQVSGAGEADYNGFFRITVTGADTFTYTVPNAPASPATGTITIKVAPAVVNGNAWTEDFTSGSISVFRGPVGTKRRYFRFDDNSTGTSNVRAFEAMTDINTGTGPFPTVAQLASGMFVGKSSTTDGTARPWIAVSNGSIIYIRVSLDSANQMFWMWFGDFVSERSGDEFNTILVAGRGSGLDQNNLFSGMQANATVGTQQAYIPRPVNQIGSSLQVVRYVDAAFTNAGVGSFEGSTMGSVGNIPFPAPANGGLYLVPVFIIESSSTYLSPPRGIAPGLWCPAHAKPLNDLDEYDGTGAFAGRRFKAFNANQNSSGQVFLEISDTWG
jgi:hypothetical protein